MRLIPLTKGQSAIVDDEDYQWLLTWKWHYHKNKHSRVGYARRRAIVSGKVVLLRMHREILKRHRKLIRGRQVDHRDCDGINNRKRNLRVTGSRGNRQNVKTYRNNTTGFKGVHRYKATGRFSAGIRVNGLRIHLGYFSDRLDAARAYDRAAKRHFGRFAQLNFA